MRTFDLAPLYRSTIGFDRLFSLLDQAGGFRDADEIGIDLRRVEAVPRYVVERPSAHAAASGSLASSSYTLSRRSE